MLKVKSNKKDINDRAIIVEDTQTWQDIFRGPLEDNGLVVTVADNLQDATALVDRHFYHVAVLDLALDPDDDGNRDGMKILRRLFELWEGTGSILISGIGTMEIGWEAGFYQALSVIEKGRFNLDSYAQIVQMGLEQAKKNLSKQSFGVDYLAAAQPATLLVDKISRTLDPVGKYFTLNDLVKDLLRGLNPFFRYRGELDAQINENSKEVTIRLWTRALGQPLLVKLGGDEAIQDEVDAMVNNPDKLRAAGYDEIIKVSRSKNIAGIVYSLLEDDFENYIRLKTVRDFEIDLNIE